MKKLILWLLMVALFVALLLGGTVGAFYFMIDEDDLPEETATFGGVTLQNSGYEWDVPVFGGVVSRNFYQPATLSVQKLGDFGNTRPDFVLPDWVSASELTLTAPDGTTAFSGDAAGYADFTYTQNGTYTLSLTLRQQSTEKPAKPIGWYLYQASFTVNFNPEVTLSKQRASQGDVVALMLTGILGDGTPTTESNLGNIWFRSIEGGWMGYIAVPYNCPGGDHAIQVTCGDVSMEVVLTVTQTQYTTVPGTPSEPLPAGANEEYRNAIWPLYESSQEGKLWSGAFQHPCNGSVLVPYGSVYMTNGARDGQATGLTYAAPAGSDVYSPQAGVVVYAGNLALSGGTVVVDHGCGVKSYLFGLGEVTAQRGQTVAKGDVLGKTSDTDNLIYEIRIGNKSVDPAKAIAGQSGLQWRE
ncbi:M23 family metallopeptidase [uncultured Gemmiger sp.]|uniref:murein hydrolase activator EnvC family protein n=1 Tax=uncultured Gemmiger sp. TaxID=1623490 RepID=UPI0025F6375E|nr:M23 family metallopeptidase [uncultured Gemmiger sp.]